MAEFKNYEAMMMPMITSGLNSGRKFVEEHDEIDEKNDFQCLALSLLNFTTVFHGFDTRFAC